MNPKSNGFGVFTPTSACVILNRMIPNALHPFFWDINLESFDPQAHPEYAIERILELGTPEAISWLDEQFSSDQISAVIRTNRRLSPKSATFWALVYRIPAGEVAVLR